MHIHTAVHAPTPTWSTALAQSLSHAPHIYTPLTSKDAGASVLTHLLLTRRCAPSHKRHCQPPSDGWVYLPHMTLPTFLQMPAHNTLLSTYLLARPFAQASVWLSVCSLDADSIPFSLACLQACLAHFTPSTPARLLACPLAQPHAC